MKEKYIIIKPKINIFLLLIQSLLILIPFIFIFIPLIIPFILIPSWNISNFLIYPILFFSIIFIIIILTRMKTLKETEYRFYKDKIEYNEGFLTKYRKTIDYNKITNIGQRKGVLENLFGLGSIYIDTAGFSPRGHELLMRYIKNPDEIYDKIKELTSKKK